MTQLIQENKFVELKEALKNSRSGLKIHNILLQLLNNEIVNENDYGFEANTYQEEFLEGFKLYKVLNTSTISKSHLQAYKEVLVFLTFKLGGFIKLLADTAMRKGVYLSQIDVYKVDPALRDTLQSFIGLLEETNDIKALANAAAAKAQISLSIRNLLNKPEIGQDMLQFAMSYENAGLKEQAVKIYQNILKDFESESVKASSGLFPEITHADTRTLEEITIFETAKSHLAAITGITLPDVKRAHVDVDPHAKQLVEQVHNLEGQISTDKEEQNKTGFWKKIRKRFV